MSKPQIEIIDEGEAETYSADEYAAEGGMVAAACSLAVDQGHFEDGSLEDEVMHQPEVVERARDEGAFVARITIPFWFRQDDDEVYETFGEDDTITALVEDYSEKAWRIIGSRETTRSGSWFVWEWTFIPKSLATVTRVVGVEDKDDGWDFRAELRDADTNDDEWFETDADDADVDAEA